MPGNGASLLTIGGSPSWQARCAEWLLRLIVKRRFASEANLTILRDRFAKLDRRWVRIPANITRTAVDADGVACKWIDTPGAKTQRVILYFHGGGFAVRLPSLYARFTARLGRVLGARVLLVDYRLTPEHRFPAAVEDCYTAYRWLVSQGFAPGNIVIAGDSAGGNLALVTLLKIKAARDPNPACAVALSPGVDLTLSSPSCIENRTADALLRTDTVGRLVAAYADADQLRDGFVSPLFGELAGLPPLLLQAGTREILRDDAVRFGEAACSAGVAADVQLWRGMQHCFQLLAFLPESRRALDACTEFVARHTDWVTDQELPHAKADRPRRPVPASRPAQCGLARLDDLHLRSKRAGPAAQVPANHCPSASAA